VQQSAASNVGDGHVTISYDPSTNACPPGSEAPGGTQREPPLPAAVAPVAAARFTG